MKKEWWLIVVILLVLLGALLFYPYAMSYEEPSLSPGIYSYCIYGIKILQVTCTNQPLTTPGNEVDRLLGEVGNTLVRVK